MSWVKYDKIIRCTVGYTKKVLSIEIFDLYSQINNMYILMQLEKYVSQHNLI